ncbi:MAG: PhoH family protein [Saezia sp.]
MPLPPPPSKRADRVKSKAPNTKKADTKKTTSPVSSVSVDATSKSTSSLPSPPSVSASFIVEKSPLHAHKQQPPAPKKKGAQSKTKKLFILDTNVLMHDPTSLFRFQEHDIFITLTTLEELDNNKRGTTEVARNARQASRYLDELVSGLEQHGIASGIALNRTGQIAATGKILFQTESLGANLPVNFPNGKADNQILIAVYALSKTYADRPVILVSKDINMRIKARALGFLAEDYTSDKTLDDGDLMYSGAFQLPPDFWDTHSKNMQSWQENGFTFYRLKGPLASQLAVNQFIYYEAPDATPLYARVIEVNHDAVVFKTLKDYANPKNSVWGINARNREQNFALNILMDPEIDFITLAGQAGTGKTLLALAAGLTQVLDQRLYSEIIMTRVTVSVGEDIGFLPGTEEEKMNPWMGALDDNLEVLSKTDGSEGDWGKAATNELVRNKIKIKSLNFMRGRTFISKFLIIDEAQNLTPKQMKTLITRAGPNTKVICMGNLAQIDTPYLTEGSSGLTYVVNRFKGWGHSAHITLARGERSRLADFASDVL